MEVARESVRTRETKHRGSRKGEIGEGGVGGGGQERERARSRVREKARENERGNRASQKEKK